METTPFELTPEQQSLLQTLSQETGKPISALIQEAMEGLCERVRPGRRDSETNGSDQKQTRPPGKHLWEIADELLADIPEEVFDSLPTDGAAQPITPT